MKKMFLLRRFYCAKKNGIFQGKNEIHLEKEIISWSFMKCLRTFCSNLYLFKLILKIGILSSFV